jgi:hypothetical protein
MTLNILDIIKPRIDNYNFQTVRFLKLLENKLNDTVFVLLHTNFNTHQIKDFIVSKGTYYCQILVIEKSNKKSFDFPWLVMIGSNLDFIIRHFGMSYISRAALECPKLSKIKNHFEQECQQDQLSKLYTCFIISGCLKQLPVYISNNRLNFHIRKSKNVQTMVRKFVYNQQRGTQIDFSNDTLCLTSSKNVKTQLQQVSKHVCHFEKPCSACDPIRKELRLLFECSDCDELEPLYQLMQFYAEKRLNIDHLGMLNKSASYGKTSN